MYNNSFNNSPRKSTFSNEFYLKQRKSNRLSLFNEIGRISKLLSFYKKNKKELKLPKLKNSINFKL